MSKTASAITGDIQLSSKAIIIQGVNYPLTPVLEIGASDVAEVAKIVSEDQPAAARLYRVHVTTPDVCGGPTEPAEWMLAVYTAGSKGLSLAFFSGAREPNLNYQVVSVGHDLCGTFAYVQ